MIPRHDEGGGETRQASDASVVLGYRPGLDGLRAVAVAAVIAHHLWPTRLPGGFLGVDLFFVLSGFLITSLLISEYARTGTISLGAFWRRRVRRLAPIALLAIAVVVVASAVLVRDPARVDSVRVDALWSVANVANWRFAWSTQSYATAFDDPSPLQHLWSLAIEEQMYVVWPLVVLAIAAVGASLRRFCGALVVVAVAGASASVARMAQVAEYDITRAYYGTDTRAHLVLIGAALAGFRAIALTGTRSTEAASPVARSTVSRSVGGGAVWLMWVPVLVAFVAVSHTSPWLYRGGFAAIAVALGAVVIGAAGSTGPAHLLARSPLVAVGRHSYALYLWHWPAIVLLTPAVVGVSGAALVVVQLAVTVGLTMVSTHLVEAPVRAGRIAPRRTARLWLGATVVVVAVAAVPWSAPGDDVTIRSVDAVVQPPPPPGTTAGRPVVTATSMPSRAEVDAPAVGRDPTARPGAHPPPPVDDVAPEPPPLRVLVVGSDPDVTELLAASDDVELIDRSRPGCPVFPTVAVRGVDGVIETAGCLPTRFAVRDVVVEARDVDVIVVTLSEHERLPFQAHPDAPWSDDGVAAVEATLHASGSVGALLRDAATSGRPVLVVDSAAHLDDHGVRSAVRHEALASASIREATVGDLPGHLARLRATSESVDPDPDHDPDLLRVVVVGDSTSFALADGLAATGAVAVRWAGAENCGMVSTTRVRWGAELVFVSTCPSVDDWAREAIGFGADVVVVLATIPEQSEQEYEGIDGWHVAGDPAFVQAHDVALDELQRLLAPEGILTLVADAPPVAGDRSQGGFRGSAMASPERIAAWNEQIATFVDRWHSVGSFGWAGPLLDAEEAGLAYRVDGVHLDRRSVEHLAPVWAEHVVAAFDALHRDATTSGCLHLAADIPRLDLTTCRTPAE